MVFDRTARNKAILVFSAVFAFLWVLARACLQSVTIDEADTYLAHVNHPEALQWYPDANNHVLNTLLIRLFTTIFGVHHLSLRAPALIGAAIYIGVAYYFSRFISSRLSVQWGAFACLVFCPFIQDYLVAARGYGLATALLLAAIGVVASEFHSNPNGGYQRLLQACDLCSTLLGLSFAANFSFAFVNAATLGMAFVWACHAQRSVPPADRGARITDYLKTLAACVLPGLAVTAFLCSSVLLHWPKGQLIAGATSLGQSLGSIISAVLYKPNPNILNPLLLPIVERTSNSLLLGFGVFYAGCIGVIAFNRRRLETVHNSRLFSLGALVAIVAFTAMLAHWVAFRVFHVLLPRDRTGLFLATLVFLSAACIAGVEIPTTVATVFRRGLVIALVTLGIYFLLCLRLTRFKEWDFDEDVERAYWVLAYYNHKHGVRDAVVSWWYSSSFNFYSKLSGHETFDEFKGSETPYSTDKSIYVINSFDDDFIRRQGLKVVYRSDSSYLVVAVRPEIDASPLMCDCGER